MNTLDSQQPVSDTTGAVEVQPIKKVRGNQGLTRKQAAFVRHLVENPKSSATEAARQAYNIGVRGSAESTARAIASENLTKPSIISELSKYNNLVENTLINTVNDYQNSDETGKRSLAVDTAKYIHDKIHGKATQRIESSSTTVKISIDLTQQEA